MVNIAGRCSAPITASSRSGRLVTLAAMLGQIGLPGGGFGCGYGSTNIDGQRRRALLRPDAAAGHQPGAGLHPGRAHHRHAAQSRRARSTTTAQEHHLSRHPPGLLGRRQSVPSPPGPQPPARAPGAGPRRSIFHEQFWTPAAKMPTSCCPRPPASSATTSARPRASRYLIAMKQARRADRRGARRLRHLRRSRRAPGRRRRFTEGRDDRWQWLAPSLRGGARESARSGVALPRRSTILGGRHRRAAGAPTRAGDAARVPRRSRRRTRSRRRRAGSRSSPRRIAAFGYDDCPGHAVWLEPIEWLGAKMAERYPLHLLSDQPRDKLHSQLDHGPSRQATKVAGPRADHAASRRRRRRAASPTATWCACSTTAAPASPACALSDRIRRGVVRLSTGAWFDPERRLQPAAREARQSQRADARHRRVRS